MDIPVFIGVYSCVSYLMNNEWMLVNLLHARLPSELMGMMEQVLMRVMCGCTASMEQPGSSREET